MLRGVVDSKEATYNDAEHKHATIRASLTMFVPFLMRRSNLESQIGSSFQFWILIQELESLLDDASLARDFGLTVGG